MIADPANPEAVAEALANLPLDEETAKKAKEEAGNSAIETAEFVVDVASGEAVNAVAGAASAVGSVITAIASIFE
jgi:hypothetical protein